MIRFTLYQNSSLRDSWMTHLKMVEPIARQLFAVYCSDVVSDAQQLAPMSAGNPKKQYGMMSGELRRNIRAHIRGYLRVTFSTSTIDPKTGRDYGSYRETHDANHYTTSGTGAHYLQKSFDFHSHDLHELLNHLYGGGSVNARSVAMYKVLSTLDNYGMRNSAGGGKFG